MTRTTRVFPTDERYKEETKKKGYVRKLAEFDPVKFDPLSDDFAKKLYQDQCIERDQDKEHTAAIVFLNGNALWYMNPKKYDVLGLDAKNIPEYKKVPDKAYPNQIIKVKRGDRWRYYKGDKTGKFKATFPPKAKKYSPEVVSLKNSNKQLKNEISAERMVANSQISESKKTEIKEAIESKERQIKINNNQIAELEQPKYNKIR